MGVSLHFDDVTLLAFQLRRDLIQSLFSFGIQCGLRGAEVKLSIIYLLILIEVGDSRIQLSGLRIGLLRQLLRLPCLGAGQLRLLICRIRRGLCLVDTRLSPAINVLDVVRVLGCELIEFV